MAFFRVWGTGHLNLDQVHGLAQAGLRGEHGGVQRAPAGGDDLAAAAVDRVRVQHHVVDLQQAEESRTQSFTYIKHLIYAASRQPWVRIRA